MCRAPGPAARTTGNTSYCSKEIASPVGPTGHEAGKFSERALGPDVHTAFLRVARGELHHGKRQRKIKRAPGDQPDDYDAGSNGGGRRDPAQADARDDVKQHQIPKAHGAVRAIGAGHFTHGWKSSRGVCMRRTSCSERAAESERDSLSGSKRHSVGASFAMSY